MVQSVPTDYPPLNRPVEDRSGAVEAFQRLHLYACETGDHALATFAVYKALQKVEEEALIDIGNIPEALRNTVSDAVPLPGWVRAGLWTTLETYIINPKLPGRTPKQRVETFLSSLEKKWKIYSRWYAFYLKSLPTPSEKSTKGKEERVDPDTNRPGRRARASLQGFLDRMNQKPYQRNLGGTLAYVEPRDLIPTGKLLKVFQALRQ